MATFQEAFASAAEVYHANRLHDAARICAQILMVAPQHAGSLNLMGIIHARLGNHKVSCEFFERVLSAYPRWAEPFGNFGIALKDQGRLDEAAFYLKRALELNPDFVEAHNNLGHVFKAQGRPDEAAHCYRRALQLVPDAAGIRGDLVHQLQLMCQWDGSKELAERVIEDVDKKVEGEISPFAVLALPTPTTAALQLRCAERWAQEELRTARAMAGDLAFARRSKPSSRISVGYLSADFHAHATARLIVELIEKHDRNRFCIGGYSYGRDDGSPIRRRLAAAFDRFEDLENLSCADAARKIAADGVDILVDLKGYTAEARTAILVHRPAPIQVNYLGYPGTMGASFMDYILVDDFIVPGDQQPYFTERLAHLPGCYQVNDSQREIAPRTPTRAECGLPEDGFVFCSFNNNYKITSDMFAIWMRLLQAVPGSVLWLFEGNRFASANLCREAEARGIHAERLVFAPRCPMAEHLARHRLADLFLDTFPVNAHTTASDALWARCPLLTLTGKTFVSRVAGSLLRAMALPELIATSPVDYEAMALRLARDPQALGELRNRLAGNRAVSSLFDGGGFARIIEKAYGMMWDIHVSGDAPRPFAVTST